MVNKIGLFVITALVLLAPVVNALELFKGTVSITAEDYNISPLELIEHMCIQSAGDKWIVYPFNDAGYVTAHFMFNGKDFVITFHRSD